MPPVSNIDWNKITYLGRLLEQIIDYVVREFLTLLLGEPGLIEYSPSPETNPYNYDSDTEVYSFLRRHDCWPLCGLNISSKDTPSASNWKHGKR